MTTSDAFQHSSLVPLLLLLFPLTDHEGGHDAHDCRRAEKRNYEIKMLLKSMVTLLLCGVAKLEYQCEKVGVLAC